MVSTAYRLPFPFLCTDHVLSAGEPAVLTLVLGDDAGRADVAAAVDAFAQLARTGALGNLAVPPWESALTLQAGAAAGPAGELQYLLSDARLGDEALVVLAHLLLATQWRARLASVQLVSASGLQPRLLTQRPRLESTFPPPYAPLPFVLDDDEPEGGAYSFEVWLEAPLEPAHEAWLNAALSAWRQTVSLGGYGLAPVPPENGYVEPDADEITTYADRIEWALFKLRADPACIDGLVNILLAFHVRCQRIRHVEIT